MKSLEAVWVLIKKKKINTINYVVIHCLLSQYGQYRSISRFLFDFKEQVNFINFGSLEI